MRIKVNKDRKSFLVYFTALIIMIMIGRQHELVPFLTQIPLAKIMLLLAFVSLMFNRSAVEEFRLTTITRLMLFVFLLSGLSIFFSVYQTISFEFFTRNMLGMMLLLYLVVRTIRSYDILKVYLNVLIICAASLSIGVIASNTGGRVSIGYSFDANDMALFLVTILPIVIAKFITVTKKNKIILSVVISVILFSIILTGSRGAFIGLIVVGTSFLLLKKPVDGGKRFKTITFKKVIFTASLMFVMLTFAPGEYWDRISTMINPAEDYNVTSERGRLAIWGQGIDLIISNPWGVGVAAFSTAQGSLMGGRYETAHNSLIEIGGELGLLGLYIYLSLFIASKKAVKKIIADEEGKKSSEIRYAAIGVNVGLSAFFISSFFLSQAYSPLLYFLFTISDRLAYLHQVDLDKPESDSSSI